MTIFLLAAWGQTLNRFLMQNGLNGVGLHKGVAQLDALSTSSTLILVVLTFILQFFIKLH